MADALEIERGADFLYVARVRRVWGEPVMFIESHLNLAAVPGLDEVDFGKEGLFAAVERLSGKGIGRNSCIYSARAAGRRRADWLDCDEHAPVLEMDQKVYLEDDTPIEWGSVWLPANRCVISSENERAEGAAPTRIARPQL